MEKLNDIVGFTNRRIYQDSDYFNFSLDSLLLANFIEIKEKDKNILEIGTGNAVIPLLLSLNTNKKIIGVEIQEKLVELANKSIKLNNLEEQIFIKNEDIKNYLKKSEKNKYELVFSNPPYFVYDETKKINKSLEKVIARHEYKITLKEVVESAAFLLKPKGRFITVFRIERLNEYLNLLNFFGLTLSKLQFAYQKINSNATFVLIEAIKEGKQNTSVLEPIILYNDDNSKTLKHKKVLGEVI